MSREWLRILSKSVGEMSAKAVAAWCLALTVGIELFTCLLRSLISYPVAGVSVVLLAFVSRFAGFNTDERAI